jgi:hypothetical protein
MEKVALPKIYENTRTLGSYLQLVATPFSNFCITTTLHHRLLVLVLFISRGLAVRWNGGGKKSAIFRAYMVPVWIFDYYENSSWLRCVLLG